MSTISIITNLIAIIKSYSFYSSIVILTIGIIGNVLNILIFTTRKIFQGNICCFYLKLESIINIGALLLTFTSNILSTTDDDSIIWCKVDSILSQIFTPLSFSIICCAAIDQYISTCPIFYIRQFSTIKSARYSVLIVTCLWIIHSIPVGIFFNIYPRIGCIPLNLKFIQYYLYFYYPVLLGILPTLISSVFSLLAFRNVRRIIRRHTSIIRRRLDQQLTTLIFSRVIVLVTLNLPYIIYYIYSSTTTFTTTNIIQILIVRLIGTIFYSFAFLNHAITFYIFVICSSRYRRQIKYLLTKQFNRNRIIPMKEK